MGHPEGLRPEVQSWTIVSCACPRRNPAPSRSVHGFGSAICQQFQYWTRWVCIVPHSTADYSLIVTVHEDHPGPVGMADKLRGLSPYLWPAPACLGSSCRWAPTNTTPGHFSLFGGHGNKSETSTEISNAMASLLSWDTFPAWKDARIPSSGRSTPTHPHTYAP